MQWVTNAMGNMRFGRLNLVDLAGSERYDIYLLDDPSCSVKLLKQFCDKFSSITSVMI